MIEDRDDETEDMFENEFPQVRNLRESEERGAEARPMTWRPAARLPDPSPREGWSHRWVRRSTQNSTDPVNMSRALQEGWIPCKPDDYPEFGEALRLRGDSDSSIIEFGGLILMRMPEELARQRKAYFQQRAERQIGSVNKRLTQTAGEAKLDIHNSSKTRVKRTPY